VQLLLRSRKNCIEALSFEICIIRPEFVLENPHKLFNNDIEVLNFDIDVSSITGYNDIEVLTFDIYISSIC
jgi:hypothetical protein